MEWEYKTVRAEAMRWFASEAIDKQALDHDLDEFGKAGWELAAVLHAPASNGRQCENVIVFKRRRD
jgi:hypothetical protein